MRVLVVGAGALGSWVGAQLERGGADVTLVARGPHGAAMAADGLELVSAGEVGRTRPAVVGTVREAFGLPASSYDVTLVTVKSYATAVVGAELASAAGPVGRVVSLQNGVGNEAVLAAAIAHASPAPLAVRAAEPCAAVGAGVVTIGLTVDRPGRVVLSGGGGIGLEDDVKGWGQQLAEPLRIAGVDVRLGHDPVALKWSKLLLNMLGAATCAILDQPPADVLARRDMFGIEVAAWREALAVMRVIGAPPTDLPGYPVRSLALGVRRLPAPWLHALFGRRLAERRGRRHSGVSADLSAGRTSSEIEVLHGAVAAVAEARGLPSPACRTLAALVLGLADGTVERARFAGRPAALLAAVHAAGG